MAKIDPERLRRIGLALSAAVAAAWVFSRFTDALPLSEWFLPRLLSALVLGLALGRSLLAVG